MCCIILDELLKVPETAVTFWNVK